MPPQKDTSQHYIETVEVDQENPGWYFKECNNANNNN